MEREKEEYEKQLKRSNDKKLKLDHECCGRVREGGPGSRPRSALSQCNLLAFPAFVPLMCPF